ncbi:MAG: hypothetical protein AAF611_20890 [Bacteroidota bacterium]
MLQLYKSRDFNLFFKDTFAFLKMHSAHFFKNLFLVNGFFMAVLIAMNYIFDAQIAELQALGVIDPENGYERFFNYLGQNASDVSFYGFIYAIVAGFFGILAYAYIPLYFKLYERHQGPNFTSKEISKELFANLGRLVKFFLATILISIPLMFAASIVMGIMFLTIIGIPFTLFVVALLLLFYHSALMEYLKYEDKGIFDCYGYSLQLCLQQFFPSIGAVGIFALIIGIFQFTIGLLHVGILYFLGISVVDDPTYLNDLDKTSFLFIIAFTLKIAMYVINFMTAAMIQTNLSMVYYGLKEDRENIHTQNTIDSIGEN